MTKPRKLRILTNNVHTSYACELARLGHDFLVENGNWDDHLRPRPENWKTLTVGDVKQSLSVAAVKPDLILVNHDWELAEKYSSIDAPMIFSVLADCSEGEFPVAIEERASAVTFLGKEVHDRWVFRNPLKKRILELGMDGSPFVVGERKIAGVLTVGSSIGKRWDKGHYAYAVTTQFVPITLVGPGNEDLRGSIGVVTYEKLLELYGDYQVYFNPGPICGISMVEAMMAGMALVTFRTINLCDLIVDGVNGYIVDTVDGAVNRLRQLKDDIGLRMTLGAAARETAMERFSIERWKRSWEYLFGECLR